MLLAVSVFHACNLKDLLLHVCALPIALYSSDNFNLCIFYMHYVYFLMFCFLDANYLLLNVSK